MKRYIATFPLQSYKATLFEGIRLTSLGEMPTSFTYDDALAGNQAHRSVEAILVTGKIGKGTKDIGSIRPPIHSEFVNWGCTPADISRFTKRFGVLWECYSSEDYDFSFEVSDWVRDQKRFKAWWQYQLGAKPPVKLSPEGAELKALELKARQYQRAVLGLPAIADVGQQSFLDDLKNLLEYSSLYPETPVPSLAYSSDGKGIKAEIVAPDLWRYMILRLLAETPAMLRVCQNKTCPNPYFVATRKDQKFCCSRCSQLVASRRWWASEGSNRRRKRNSDWRKKGNH